MAKSSGKGMAVFALIAIVGAWIGIGMQPDDDSASPNGETSVQDAAALAPPGDFALDARRSNWPPLDTNAGATTGVPVGAVNYYLVVDGSGSMRKVGCSADRPKIDVAQEALAVFVDAVPKDANLGLAVFDEQGLSERVALGANRQADVLGALKAMSVRGATPLRSAIELGYRQLTEQGRRQLGYGEYHLVVVTDGKPEPESEDPSAIVDQIIDDSPVLLHTIGFCIGTDHVLNQPQRTFYAAADSPDALKQGLADVLAEAASFDATKFSN